MQHEEQHVRQLLRRFMSGETTLDEEREIAAWLRKTGDLPDDLRDYQQMFAHFDAGMPFDLLSPPSAGRRGRRGRRLWITAAAVAACVAVAVWLFLPSGHDDDMAAARVAGRPALTALPADTAVRPVGGCDSLEHRSLRPAKRGVHVKSCRRRRQRDFPEPPPVYMAEAAVDTALWRMAIAAEVMIHQAGQESERMLDSLMVDSWLMDLWVTAIVEEQIGEMEYE